MDRRTTPIARTQGWIGLDIKIALSISDPVFQSADALARGQGISRSKFFRRAIEAYVDWHRNDGVREALDKVYAEESSDIDAAIAKMQWVTMAREDW